VSAVLKAPGCLKMSVTAYPATQSHITEHLNLYN